MLEKAEDVVANTVDVEASEEKSDDKVVVPFDAKKVFWLSVQ